MRPEMREAMREVYQAIAFRHGLEEAEIYIRDRSKFAVAARHEAWADLRARGYSFPEIAELAGWDHSSVQHGVRQHELAVEQARRAVR